MEGTLRLPKVGNTSYQSSRRKDRGLCGFPECGPYSPMQHLNQRNPVQRQKLMEKRNHAQKQYEGAGWLAEQAHELDCVFVIELSELCEGLGLSWCQKLREKVDLFEGVCKGCQVNLRDHNHMLLGKGWKLRSNNEELVRHMNLSCPGDHEHGKCEGSQTCKKTGLYTQEFARRVLQHVQCRDTAMEISGEVQDGTWAHGSLLVCGPGEVNSQQPCFVQVLTEEQKEVALRNINKIHSATGHCSNEYLTRALKRRGVDSEVLDLVKNFKCSVCEETKRTVPRNKATLEEIPPKWERLQIDGADWQHPETGETFYFVLAIDEGCRFRIGKELSHGKKFSPSAEHVIHFFEEQWLPIFGDPKTVRLDPAGAFRSQKLDDYMSSRGIMLDTIPGEAHWLISIVERSIQSTKNIMSSLALEFPEMTFHELLARSLWAQNSHDQYLGFSPMQHAFGRSPDWLGKLHGIEEEHRPVLTESGISAEFCENTKAMIQAEQVFREQQNSERLKRALRSGHRSCTTFQPGDLVFYFRYQVTKNHGSSSFKRGKFLGPARVLAVETHVDADGALKPGSCVWLFRGNRLLKAAPQQLRRASFREEAMAELEQPSQPIPWTVSSILKDSSSKVFDDISKDWDQKSLEDMNISESGDEHLHLPEPLEPPSSASRASRPREDVPEHESDSKRKRWKSPTHRVRLKQQGTTRSRSPHREVHLAFQVSEEPSVHLKEENACISVEIGLPDKKFAKKKSWQRDLGTFLANQIKKNHIEVFEKKLTEEEKKQFQSAKEVEIKNFIMSKVFEKLPEHMKPDRSQALKMRWVLTWKINPDTHEKKPKARAVILGYMDPEYERRPTASPTVSRNSRQLFLQAASSYRFTVEKGDVSGAFLQGRNFDRTVLCEPLPEICEHLGLPSGSVTKLTRAAYGLVEAPLEWYLTINEFLESIHFRRQQSDPCVWGLFDADQKPIGWACSHVDDFMFAGDLNDERWQKTRKAIQERFRWGDWEKGKFTQCGVQIEALDNGGFCISQQDFLEGVEEIHIPKKRWENKEDAATPSEKQQMRSVLGGLSWHAGQVAMDLCASVGILLSRTNHATVSDLIEVNKVLRLAKARKNQKMIIHSIPPEELVVSTWVDAAHANREDGSSTKGVFVGCSSRALLDGALEKVSPIYWASSKITRVCRSSASAETRAAVDGEDQMFAIRFQLAEFLGFPPDVWDVESTVRNVTGILVSDSKNVYDRLSQTMMTIKGAEKRSDLESLCLKEAVTTTETILRWVNGDSQLANSLTKGTEPHQMLLFLSRNCRWRIVYDSEILSGRKRKSMGISSLEHVAENISNREEF